MQCQVMGLGIWGPGFCDWASFSELLNDANELPDKSPQTLTPKPELIPARERRRSPLCVRMAVEVAAQACDQAGVAPSDTACVFASSMGDSEITDYMCGTLATNSKLVSPTKFHNSVHNAAAGYWSISTSCQQPVNSVAGFDLTASMALLEAAVFSIIEQRPVLMVLFDIATPATLRDFIPIRDSFAAAMVLTLAPREAKENDTEWPILSLKCASGTTDWPALNLSRQYNLLHRLYTSNPSARILTLFERIRRRDHSTCHMPLGENSVLALSLTNPSNPT